MIDYLDYCNSDGVVVEQEGELNFWVVCVGGCDVCLLVPVDHHRIIVCTHSVLHCVVNKRKKHP